MNKKTTISYDDGLTLLLSYIMQGKKVTLVGLTLKESRDYLHKVLGFLNNLKHCVDLLKAKQQSCIEFKNGGVVYVRSFGRGAAGCYGLSSNLFIIGSERGKPEVIESLYPIAYRIDHCITEIIIPKE